MSAVRAVLACAGVAAFVALVPAASFVATAQIKDDNRGDKDASIFGVDWSKGDAPLAGESRDDAQKRLLSYKPEPEKFPIQRTPWDGKPYFGGVWWPSDVVLARPPVPLEKLYRPEVRPLRESTEIVNWRNGFSRPMFHCIPSRAVVGNTAGPLSTQVVHGPGILAVFPEANQFRLISIGGTRNPARRQSYMGDAVAHWEGDTLVVETTNFKPGLWLGAPRGPNPPQTASDALKITERWTRPDGRMLEYESMVEDPKMLTAPWKGDTLRMGRTELDAVIEMQPCFEDPELVRIEEEYQRKHAQTEKK